MYTRLRRLGAVVLVATVALAVQPAASHQQGGRWPGASWPEATPASQGLSSAVFDAIDRDARNGAYGNLDRLVVIRHGYMVVNHRYANTTYQLEYSRDWIAFTLSQPMDAAPGTRWVYNTGGSMPFVDALLKDDQP